MNHSKLRIDDNMCISAETEYKCDICEQGTNAHRCSLRDYTDASDLSALQTACDQHDTYNIQCALQSIAYCRVSRGQIGDNHALRNIENCTELLRDLAEHIDIWARIT
jgi:hypothetical protein